MANTVFWNIAGIILFTILLFVGMKLSKNNQEHMRIGGYVLMIVSVLGLLTDIYNLIHNLLG
jgi:hypothetical protein